jgi:hypothetical protein
MYTYSWTEGVQVIIEPCAHVPIWYIARDDAMQTLLCTGQYSWVALAACFHSSMYAYVSPVCRQWCFLVELGL